MPGIVTHPLLLETATPACSVLLYGQGGTGLGTQPSSQATGGEEHWDMAGHLLSGDTAMGGGVATTATTLSLHKLRGHLGITAIPRDAELDHFNDWLTVRTSLDCLLHVLPAALCGGVGAL